MLTCTQLSPCTRTACVLPRAHGGVVSRARQHHMHTRSLQDDAGIGQARADVHLGRTRTALVTQHGL